jgi:hypothetical protein
MDLLGPKRGKFYVSGETDKFFFFFFAVLGSELRSYTLSYSTSFFIVMFSLEIGSHELFWPRTVSLLISGS